MRLRVQLRGWKPHPIMPPTTRPGSLSASMFFSGSVVVHGVQAAGRKQASAADSLQLQESGGKLCVSKPLAPDMLWRRGPWINPWLC